MADRTGRVSAIFHWHSKPRKHRCFEFDVDLWGFKRGIHWLIVSIETSYRTDHGGFHSTFVVCNLKVEFNYYDVRHWDEAAGRYNLESEC
jgi:hypothetical protein